MIYHVHTGGGRKKWVVRRDYATRATKRFDRKSDALRWARARATVIVNHRADGTVIRISRVRRP